MTERPMSIPGQLLAIALAALEDLFWYPLIFTILWHQDDTRDLHWAVWMMFWVALPAACCRFVLVYVLKVKGADVY